MELDNINSYQLTQRVRNGRLLRFRMKSGGRREDKALLFFIERIARQVQGAGAHGIAGEV